MNTGQRGCWPGASALAAGANSGRATCKEDAEAGQVAQTRASSLQWETSRLTAEIFLGVVAVAVALDFRTASKPVQSFCAVST